MSAVFHTTPATRHLQLSWEVTSGESDAKTWLAEGASGAGALRSRLWAERREKGKRDGKQGQL